MLKINKFLLMGMSSFVLASSSFILVSASMTQDDLYQDVVTTPIESIQSLLGINNGVRDKYHSYIEEDKKFLASLNIDKEILDVEVIYKSHSTIDKVFYPLMKFGQWAFNWSEERKATNQEKYEGRNTSYSIYLDPHGQLVNEYIMLGINNLEEKNLLTYKGLYQIFGHDEKKMTSFIFFHEFAHKLARSVYNEEENIQALWHTFEKEKGITLTKEDKQIIAAQYGETFADHFSLSMMVKKYPDVDFEKSRDLIAGLRITNGSSTHFSAPGLIQATAPAANAKLDDILKSSEKSALVTAQYYSPIDFSKLDSANRDAKRAIPVKLAELDIENVREKIVVAREKFLNKPDLKTYKK